MRFRGKLKLFIIFLMAILALGHLKNSFAQNKEPFLFCKSQDSIRVGITTNDFSSTEYKEISLTSQVGFIATDAKLNEEIVKASPQDVLKIQIIDGKFTLFLNDKKTAENIEGPIQIAAENSQPVEVVGLKRRGKPAAYRGEFQIVKNPSKQDKFYAINTLPLEEYLRGVVPNELPVSFGLEALKAQAVAARNYALRPRTQINKFFDVCDSVQSQVYFGINTENPLSDKAVVQTSGQVALYNGEPILALYSSTAGGYTESYENAFSERGSEKFPANPLPYLKGKPDTEGTPPLNTEEAARSFYTSCPASMDCGSSYFRWTRTWQEADLRRELNASLSKFSSSSLISPKFEKGTDIGKIKKLEVLSRGVSGKAIEVKISAENGEWNIKKELIIRRVFTFNGSALPSANIVFQNTYDDTQNLLTINVFGGGYGHGVGMSQYGAGFMSKNGATYDKIIQHYYDGVSIGTLPVTIQSGKVFTPVKQKFYSSSGKADLVIENYNNVDNFDFMINSTEISLSKNHLPQGKIRMPLNNYTKTGLNEIIYGNINSNTPKSVKVWIEVVKSEK